MDQFDFGGQVTPESFNKFLVYAGKNNVSDIMLQGGGKVWVDRYGRQMKMTDYPLDVFELERVIDHVFTPDIKTQLKKARIVNKALQLKGDAQESIGLGRGETMRFRANFTQATIGQNEAGISLTMRVLNSKIPELDSLGLPADLQRSLLPAAGLAFICGETGSGKSTLLASIFQHSGETNMDRKIITVESPVEYILGGDKWIAPEAAQSEVGRDVSSFAEFIALSALRRSPKVIGVGELLEREAFEAALVAGKSGHFCPGTMHVKTCGDSIQRALLMFPAEMREAVAFDVLTVVSYIIVQRLLKTTDGKRQAVREYVVFDYQLRRKMLDMKYTQWGRFIDDLLMQQQSTIVHHAWNLYRDNRIDEEEMIEVAGYLDFMRLKEGKYGQ